jgi:beta-glucanase (GH16 family)
LAGDTFFGGIIMMQTKWPAILAALAALLGCAQTFAQDKGTIAPDQIPGMAVYVPFPVSITVDGNTDDWKGIPVQRVETAFPKSPDPKQNQYFDFAVAADEKNFYVHMESDDSNIVAGQHKTDFWNEDSMEFYLNFTKNLAATSYKPGIMQINVNATNIGKKPGDKLSVTGTNAGNQAVRGIAFKTSHGWVFEAAVPLPAGFSPSHGSVIGFQAQANGATALDRDSKLIWSKADTDDLSYQNPSLFGQAIFFKLGSADVPQALNLSNDLPSVFTKEGATGKTGKKLVWGDEFDYQGGPDPKKWDYDSPDCGKYNQELQIYTDSRDNSAVTDGSLAINAIKDAAGKWTSARLETRGTSQWTYGYFEARMKLPAGVGTWPAFWMMPTNDAYGSWPASGEIDIMEWVGFEPAKIHTSAHTKAFNHRINTQKTRAATVNGVTDGFHTYAVEWTPKGLFWYVDDQPYYSFGNTGKGNAEWPFNKPFYLILNLAMGGSWGGMKGVDPALNKVEMLVDYVRVYQ